MSKGLDALERIKMLEISCDRESYDLRPITKTHKEDLSTIEKELKESEKKDHYIETLEDRLANIETTYARKSKALGLFLEKLGLSFKFESDLIICVFIKNKFDGTYTCKTQEEYDSLKEVLL